MQMIIRNYINIFLLLALLGSIPALARNERRDSIRASVVTADRSGAKVTGTRILKPVDFRHFASVTGTGDAIKYVQTLPGVSTGADGSSSFYVRGGNLGNNVITMDGVPIYGSSHLLGFSSVYPNEIVSDIRFQVGGFTSEEGNLTSSHMNISTLDGNYGKATGSFSISNFMAGGSVSAPIVKNKLSLLASVHLSPIGPELSAAKKLTHAMDSISAITAAVYDVYAKLSWKISRRNSLAASFFNSLDSYGYNFGVTSEERMRWSNLVGMLKHEFLVTEEIRLQNTLAYNRFYNYQAMRKVLGDTDNDIAMLSGLSEWSAASTVSGSRGIFSWQGGLKGRFASFFPASTSSYAGSVMTPVDAVANADRVNTSLITLHAQAELAKDNRYLFRAAGRLNSFTSKRVSGSMSNSTYFNPEAGLLAKMHFTPSLGMELTADWTTQYYHTLEGIPLGWSLDMMVASDRFIAPEKASQYYAGFFFSTEHHRASAGAYLKNMKNLIWFQDATQIFDSAAKGWREGIKTGTGSSKGVELLYETYYDLFSAKLAYTLSKTDRVFPDINTGNPFPAKFDRRHIFNFTANCYVLRKEKLDVGISTLFTYQSGHWATIAAGRYEAPLPGPLGDVVIDYYTTIHNWQLPAYIRWDLGVFINHGKKSRCPGTLNVGVYNVLNRHNAYSITYDSTERKWKQLSLFPIMPSLSWSLEF